MCAPLTPSRSVVDGLRCDSVSFLVLGPDRSGFPDTWEEIGQGRDVRGT